MKTLVISDAHNNCFWIEEFLKDYKDHQIIYVGDYFDNFHDSAHEATETAIWLQYSLNQPNRIHLWGNHDISYHYSNTGCYNCPGFTEGKNLAINSIMKPSDWDKLKFYHFDGNFWYSHAGFNINHFPVFHQEDPTTGGISNGYIQSVLDDQFSEIFPIKDLPNPIIWASDYRRGGRDKHAGILWEDWKGLKKIPGINQIVGHTPVNKIKINNMDGTMHVNVDCGHSQVLEVDGKNLRVINTGFTSFYKR